MSALIRSLVVNRIWWLPLWAVYAALAGFFLSRSLDQIHRHNLDIATEGARNVFRMLVITRKWNALHGGVYVPVSDDVQPNPYLTAPRRDIETRDGQKLTLINPAYMTRMIGDMTADARNAAGLSFRITSQKPLNPHNAPDDWERQALLQLTPEKAEVTALVEDAGHASKLRFLAPLWVSEECLACHRSQGYQVGDLRGGISITQDYTPFLAAARPSEVSSIIAHGAVFLLFVLISGGSLSFLRRSWLALERNIETLNQARHELLQSEKMASLGRMVAGFAHELNTPVGIAVGAVSHNDESLQQIDRLLGTEEVDEAALRAELAALKSGGALALANLRRAASLVQRFKQSSIDQMSEQRRAFVVRELIDDVVFSLKGALGKASVEVVTDCDPTLRILGVPGLFEQLLTNLLLNSLQHGFADGTRPGRIDIVVDVPSTQPPRTLRIRYRDNGAGMAPAVAERIFEPFFTTRRGQGGTGLGMFLCYNIVTTELAGRISCTGNPGAGVAFEIVVPFELAEAGSPP